MGSNPTRVIVLVAELVKPLFVEQKIAGSSPVKYLEKLAERLIAPILKIGGASKLPEVQILHFSLEWCITGGKY